MEYSSSIGLGFHGNHIFDYEKAMKRVKKNDLEQCISFQESFFKFLKRVFESCSLNSDKITPFFI